MPKPSKKPKKPSPVLLASLQRLRSMGVPFRRVDALLPWLENPRDNAPAVPAVVASLQEFGWTNPVLYRAEGDGLIAGHTRILAAKALGLEEVPAIPLTLDEAKAKLYALADNRLNELAPWTSGIADIFAGFSSSDLAIAGFSDPAAWLAETFPEMPLPEPPSVEDDVPEPPRDPISRLGDIWTLGRHMLVCGDSRLADRWFGAGTADIMVTDPPYGVKYVGTANSTPIENDALPVEELSKLWLSAFSVAHAILRPGAAYYVTGASSPPLLVAWLDAMQKAGIPGRHLLIWKKNSLVLGRSDYHYQHEPIVYGWKEGAAHHKVTDRTQSSVWEIDRPSRSEEHPTMKPVELYARAMRNSTHRDGVLYEPFGGSGTGLIAAEQTGRTARVIEISPGYCDVIVERWQNLTGEKATRQSS